MKSKHWSSVRAGGQLAFWFLFAASIIYLHDPISDVDYGVYPSLSIHLISVGYIIGYTVKYALLGIAIAFLTLLLGRFFCGWICPLGVTVDAADAVVKQKGKEHSGKRRIKYLIMIASFLLAVLGFNAAGYIDPIAIVYRTYELFLYPFLSYLGSEPLSWVLPGYQARDYPSYYHNWFWVAVVFFGIVGLSWISKRFWCRVLCPFGAMLALASHLSFFRRKADSSACVHCGACVKGCRMGAIAHNAIDTIEHECIKCFECLKLCNYNAISFGYAVPWKTKIVEPVSKGITRKDMLIVAGSSIMIAATRVSLFAASHHHYMIRPPGALTESSFMDACVRCGQCMNVCPTNALHPSFVEAGFYGMYTPRLIPRIGYCDFTCIRCGQVCPTAAIQPLSLKEKQKVVIGTAYIIRDICIPWSEFKDCLVCEEVCPIQNKAITFEKRTVQNKENKSVEVLFPIVHEDRCIGCGICENRCPVSGRGAIVVMRPKLVRSGLDG